MIGTGMVCYMVKATAYCLNVTRIQQTATSRVCKSPHVIFEEARLGCPQHRSIPERMVVWEKRRRKRGPTPAVAVRVCIEDGPNGIQRQLPRNEQVDGPRPLVSSGSRLERARLADCLATDRTSEVSFADTTCSDGGREAQTCTEVRFSTRDLRHALFSTCR